MTSFTFCYSCQDKPNETTKNVSKAALKVQEIKKPTMVKSSTDSTVLKVSNADLVDQVVGKDFEQSPTKAADANQKKNIKKSAAIEKTKTEKELKNKAAKPKNPKPQRKPAVRFDRTSFAFNTIEQGDSIRYQFTFKNTGNAPLEITKVKASCGCTQPSYPFLPIEAGESGTIGVLYDSHGKLGKQRPEIKVYTNAQKEPYILQLSGLVLPPEKKEETTTEVQDTSAVKDSEN